MEGDKTSCASWLSMVCPFILLRLEQVNSVRENGQNRRWSSAVQFSNAKDDLPDFNDSKAAFQAKSTLQLLQSLAVFTACTSKPFISNADKVFDISKRVFSRALVTRVVKNTFFKHFCAGNFSQANLAVCKVGSIFLKFRVGLVVLILPDAVQMVGNFS